MTDSLRKKLGAGLLAQRRHWGLTQEQLAERIGVTPRYLAALERGERNVTLDTFGEYAGYFGLDTQALLTGELRDELPPQRARPADANPKGRRKK
ncbi:helix-turn-helix domain-containing protein [Leucobacter luti]|uniref:Helix-turn-helix protein n=1 Tax=Leucobacter luti TaxID=340320 RepID=A0A4Q7TK29_9MICO|nr:helix-turn-helix transcriptional regulator [Leucobacter luti]MBL3700359.1 XRE family transcriptional regulator [Leucobacter luti]RZT60527.1 helix-turn-helix protein [Leucobacter luti]